MLLTLAMLGIFGGGRMAEAEEAAASASPAASSGGTLPPIDTVAHPSVETATFALG
jgi:hypothetical protein